MSCVKLPLAVPLLVLSGLCLIAFGCGGLSPKNLSGPASLQAPVGTFSISPDRAVLSAGNSLQFTAVAKGTLGTDLEWLANGVAGGNSSSGTISRSGLYTAPQAVTSSTAIVVAVVSKGDPTRASNAALTVLPGPVPIAVSVSPSIARLSPSQVQQFTATVKGTTNQGISWFVNDTEGGNSSVGTISSAGIYTAPPIASPVVSITITAGSTYDTAVSATATVTLMASAAPPADSSPITAPANNAYYVDASAGNDSNDGRSPTTAWRTIAKVNASSFSPGDSVLFNKGRTWREMLTPPSSGSAGNPITFAAYGSGPNPIISGSDLLTAWATEGSYYYKAVTLGSYVNAVTQTFFDGARLASVGSKGALATGKWWWDAANTRVYIYDNPAGHTVEANTKLRALSLTARSYVTFQNLHFTKANQDNIGVYSTAGTHVVTDLTFDHILSDYAFEHGMFDYSPSPYAHNNVTISYSEFAFNNASGIEKNGIGDSWLVDHSSFHDNSLTNADAFTGGIRFVASNSNDRATNVTIQYSVAYNNGTDVAGIVSTAGDGLWFDTVGAGCKMVYNLSYNNHDAGILVEGSTGVLIQGNVASGNANGIRFYNHVQNSKVYNNTVYESTSSNILMRGLFGGGDPGGFIANEVKNNISIGSGRSFLADYGGENDGTNGSGNVYTYNAFGVQAANFIQWGTSTLSTYAAFDAAYGTATHSVAGDPKFKNAAGGDFSLLNGSPAVDTGTNLGVPYSLDNDPRGAFPWVTADQNNYGSGWDIGAFVFIP
jgi:parallel beta-helix repeat protein